jgi:hypothetical protein
VCHSKVSTELKWTDYNCPYGYKKSSDYNCPHDYTKSNNNTCVKSWL